MTATRSDTSTWRRGRTRRDDPADIVVTGRRRGREATVRRMSLDQEKLSELDIRILPCDACSGCQNVISAYLNGRQLTGRWIS